MDPFCIHATIIWQITTQVFERIGISAGGTLAHDRLVRKVLQFFFFVAPLEFST